MRLGSRVYIRLTRSSTLTIGDGVCIERDCQLISEGALSLGSDSFVGQGTIIVAAERIRIGRDALIAAYVTIRDQDHRLDRPEVPTKDQALETAPILIGDNVWVGTKATVLKGVTLGDAVVIAANAIVNRDVEPFTIVGGIPAKVIKRRLG